MEPTREKRCKRRIAELEAQLARCDERIVKLEREVAELKVQVAGFVWQNTHLTEQIAKLSKNSSNSSKPAGKTKELNTGRGFFVRPW